MTVTRSRAVCGVVEGSPLVYGIATRITTPVGDFDEVIRPGALTGPLRRSAGLCLVREHGSAALLGIVGEGVELVDEPLRLTMVAVLVNDDLGRQTLGLVRNGRLHGMSFSASVTRDDITWHEQDSGVPLRVIHRFHQLNDVAVVERPAYRTTTLAERGRPMCEKRRFAHRLAAHRIAGTGGLTHIGRSCPPPAVLDRWLSPSLWRAAYPVVAP